MGFCYCSIFCCALLYVHSLDGEERELVALLNLSSWCHVFAVWLFLTVPYVCLQFEIVIFPDHTNLLFGSVIQMNSDGSGESANLNLA